MKAIEILLVEDNPGDSDLMQECLRASGLTCNVRVATDGASALEQLHQRGAHSAAPRPDLVLLDLGLPQMNGREVLADVKSDPDLRRIPVIVLTQSADARDIECSYDLHANCYITKPETLEDFERVGRVIQSFWLQVAVLPPG